MDRAWRSIPQLNAVVDWWYLIVVVSKRREVALSSRLRFLEGWWGAALTAPALQSQLTPTSKGLDEFQIAAANAGERL
jgi:hypothetical protein